MTTARRVLLNALFLDPGVSGGVETYLHGLAPALLQERPEALITVASTHRGAASLRERGWPQAGIRVLELPCDEGQRVRRQIAEQWLLALAGRHRGAEVLHSLASIAPILVRGLAHVITLHDVTFIHHETFNAITSWGMRRIVPAAARRADALIADGAAARDDIARTIAIDTARFTVIALGTDPPLTTTAVPAGAIRAAFGLGDSRLVVCVASLRPHKNQELLIEALPSLPGDVRLVLVGHAEPYAEVLRAQARDRGLAERVAFAGRISNDELEGLWSAASVAAMPTLAEGFGLPLVEAMARGVPAAVSDIPVLREVGGDWPAYFDPRDPDDAARAIRGLLDSPPPPERGRAMAERFSWPAVAAATWEVYDRAVAVAVT